MARSHWYVAATWAALLAATAIACGDSATGADIPEPEDGGSSGKDGGSSGRDGSVLPPADTGTGDIDSGIDSGPKGDGGLPTVSDTVLDFGQVDCGQTGLEKKLTISNPGTAAVSFTTELVKASASPFTLSPTNGVIPSGGSIEVTVTPKAIPTTGVSTTSNAFGDTLKLAIGSTNAQVDLKQTAHGVSLKVLTNSGTDFGNVPTTAGPVNLSFQLANAGNQAAPVTMTVVADDDGDAGGGAFTVTPPASSLATPGTSPATITFAPSAIAGYSAKVHVDIDPSVALCDVLPNEVTFTGKGTDGVVSISPLGFIFGNAGAGTTDCGTTALPQVIHITNSSNKAFLIKSAALTKGTTLYTLTSGTTTGRDSFSNLNVPANGTVDLTIVPRLVPQNNSTNPTAPDAFADKLTITTDAPGDPDPHEIPLHQTAHGAYIVRSTSSTISLGTVAVGVTSAPQTFTWQNVGNADINLTQSLLAGTYYEVAPSALALGAGASPTTASVTFTPTATGTFPDTITVAQKAGENVVLCQTLPGGLGVTGAGGNAQLVANNSATNSTLAFGGIPCGTTSPSSKVLKIQNNGPAGTFTATLRKGAISPFTLSSTGGPIGAGEAILIDVTPKPVSNEIGTVSDQSDVVDIASDTASNTPAVTLTLTPQGAIVAVSGLSSSAVSWGNQKLSAGPVSKNLTLQNNGNVPIPLTLAVASDVAGVFTGIPSSMSLALGAVNAQQTQLTFTPAAVASYAGTLTVTPDASTPLCAPLPQGATLLRGVYPLSGAGIN